jgi:CRP-like cAMP-binding protein
MTAIFDTFIRKYSNEHPLSDEAKEELFSHLSLLSFEKKHVLIRESQHHDYAYFIIEGAVRSYYLKDGVEVNTWFAFENDMVGSLQNFRNQPSRETFELIENTTFVAINLRTLRPLIHTNIEIANVVLLIIEEYAQFLEDRIFSSQFNNSLERYEALLKYDQLVLQRVPLTYIASYLGISRETLSRLRGK